MFHATFRAVRCWSSVWCSFCRWAELPEMAYCHPLLKLFYGGLRGRFPWFAPMRLPFTSKIVEHSRYLPAIQAHFVEMHTFSSSRESEFSNSINVCIRPSILRRVHPCF